MVSGVCGLLTSDADQIPVWKHRSRICLSVSACRLSGHKTIDTLNGIEPAHDDKLIP